MAGVINIGAGNADDQFYRYKMPKLQARVSVCPCYYPGVLIIMDACLGRGRVDKVLGVPGAGAGLKSSYFRRNLAG